MVVVVGRQRIRTAEAPKLHISAFEWPSAESWTDVPSLIALLDVSWE